MTKAHKRQCVSFIGVAGTTCTCEFLGIGMVSEAVAHLSARLVGDGAVDGVARASSCHRRAPRVYSIFEVEHVDVVYIARAHVSVWHVEHIARGPRPKLTMHIRQDEGDVAKAARAKHAAGADIRVCEGADVGRQPA